MFRINKKTGLLAILLIILATTIFLVLKFGSAQKNFFTSISAEPTPNPTPTPSPTPVPKTSTVSQISSDGTITLIMKTEKVSDNETNYSLFVKKENSDFEDLIFSRNLNNDTSIKLPFNSWSPNNKYFFVEQQTKNERNFLVFNAADKTFKNEEFYDINSYFTQQEIAFEFNEATGWAAPNLIIVRTKDQTEKTDGPAYWFDITSQSLIRLSTSF